MPRLERPITLPLKSATLWIGLPAGDTSDQSITVLTMIVRTGMLLLAAACMMGAELASTKSTFPALMTWMACSELCAAKTSTS